MTIRNFWMETNVDGRESVVSGGPRSKDGGMTAVFHIRNKGGSQKALVVNCFANDDGALKINIFDAQKRETVYTIETER